MEVRKNRCAFRKAGMWSILRRTDECGQGFGSLYIYACIRIVYSSIIFYRFEIEKNKGGQWTTIGRPVWNGIENSCSLSHSAINK